MFCMHTALLLQKFALSGMQLIHDREDLSIWPTGPNDRSNSSDSISKCIYYVTKTYTPYPQSHRQTQTIRKPVLE